MKMKPIKIRRTWERHPAERIKEDKEKLDPCEECGKYKTNPVACYTCECENNQAGEV